jgi:hypothetical protein
MSSKTSLTNPTDPTPTPSNPPDPNPPLTAALHRCAIIINIAERRSNPAFNPYIDRYCVIMQVISTHTEHGTIKHVGPGTVTGIETLTEEVERMLRGEYVGGVREVAFDAVERGRRDGEGRRKKRGRDCACM